MSNFTKSEATDASEATQFIAWAGDIPYIAKFRPHGAGYFHHIEFRVGDDGFKTSVANDRRELFVDPDDLREAGSAQQYLETVLANIH